MFPRGLYYTTHGKILQNIFKEVCGSFYLGFDSEKDGNYCLAFLGVGERISWVIQTTFDSIRQVGSCCWIFTLHLVLRRHRWGQLDIQLRRSVTSMLIAQIGIHLRLAQEAYINARMVIYLDTEFGSQKLQWANMSRERRIFVMQCFRVWYKDNIFIVECENKTKGLRTAACFVSRNSEARHDERRIGLSTSKEMHAIVW